MNLTPPGQMIQGSLDVNEAIHSDAPWQNRLAQGAAGVLGMATAPLGVDTRMAGSAARGLNRLDELARSGELTRPFQNEYGVLVGPNAKGWDELPGKFSSLADRMERAEIDDSGAKLNFGSLSDNIFSPKNLETKLPDIIQHQGLYDQYPFMRDVHVMNSDIAGEKGAIMASSQKGGLPTITLNKSILSDDEAQNVLLHEIQHAIQEKEGWARGGSPAQFQADPELGSWIDNAGDIQQRQDIINDILSSLNDDPKKALMHTNVYTGKDEWFTPSRAKEYVDKLQKEVSFIKQRFPWRSPEEQYRSLAGEIEARDVASRANLTPEQRMSTPPYSSEDIQLEDWIVRKGGGGNAMSVDDKLLKDAPWRQGQIEGYVDDPVQRQKNFDEWFGDSKVVDENGKPLTVYHGSPESGDIEQFRITGRGKWFGDGAYFTDEPKQASLYAEHGDGRITGIDYAKSSGVLPSKLAFKNPAILDNTVVGKPELKKISKSLSLNNSKTMGRQFDKWSSGDRTWWDVWNFLESEEFNGAGFPGSWAKDVLENAGFDGIIAKPGDPRFDSIAHGATHYVAFEPSQIKSTFNRGTYSKTDPRILYGALPLAAMGNDDNDPVLSNAPWRQQL